MPSKKQRRKAKTQAPVPDFIASGSDEETTKPGRKKYLWSTTRVAEWLSNNVVVDAKGRMCAGDVLLAIVTAEGKEVCSVQAVGKGLKSWRSPGIAEKIGLPTLPRTLLHGSNSYGISVEVKAAN
jgi:hypothetical protein